MKSRLDELLVTKGLTATRSQARHLIKDRAVLVNGTPAKKPGQLTKETDEIEITRDLYVSRGAYKLLLALQRFQIDPKGAVCADIGASTGGFTQVLLNQEVKKVYAIDVGQDQLADIIKEDPRVINMGKTNIREVESLPEPIDICVIDLSFISQTKVLPIIANLLQPDGIIISLIKPQFEAGPNQVNEKGFLSRAKSEVALGNFTTWCKKNGFEIQARTPSPIKGKIGNKEYLALITKS